MLMMHFFLNEPTSRTMGLPAVLVATSSGILPSTSRMMASSLSSLLLKSTFVMEGQSARCRTLSTSVR